MNLTYYFMEKDLNFDMNNNKKCISPLLRGITENELIQMNTAGYLRQKEYDKHEIIYHMDTIVDEIGILVNGSVNIINTDFLGNSTILSNISSGGVFAETYALLQEPLLVEVVTAEHSQILFLNIHRIMDDSTCNQSNWYRGLIDNLLQISMRKNLTLSTRIFCTTSKNIRGRLLTYLTAEYRKQGTSTFEIPFNRQQLADYLNVDRSALSKELGKMKEEGILDFHKNVFRLSQKI
ncbi:Crp/Fnr family transcriptional regulator [uncultured Eubacterium sp.]|uniref:Crp/Fnr family transcriptional regulator n=1 Tax=uncultured Eubacterium sp. TaxID=165185 RepID=UPI0025CCB2BF|nr:Crp/Fnr family transcriptional regulator [uncultured Eubacterium sp.]